MKAILKLKKIEGTGKEPLEATNRTTAETNFK